MALQQLKRIKTGVVSMVYFSGYYSIAPSLLMCLEGNFADIGSCLPDHCQKPNMFQLHTRCTHQGHKFLNLFTCVILTTRFPCVFK